MKKLTLFEVWHTNEFGMAVHKQKANDFRDCYNRCPAKIQRTFFEIVNADTGDAKTRTEFEDYAFRGIE